MRRAAASLFLGACVASSVGGCGDSHHDFANAGVSGEGGTGGQSGASTAGSAGTGGARAGAGGTSSSVAGTAGTVAAAGTSGEGGSGGNSAQAGAAGSSAQAGTSGNGGAGLGGASGSSGASGGAAGHGGVSGSAGTSGGVAGHGGTSGVAGSNAGGSGGSGGAASSGCNSLVATGFPFSSQTEATDNTDFWGYGTLVAGKYQLTDEIWFDNGSGFSGTGVAEITVVNGVATINRTTNFGANGEDRDTIVVTMATPPSPETSAVVTCAKGTLAAAINQNSAASLNYQMNADGSLQVYFVPLRLELIYNLIH